jgi:phosphatidylglycerophosphate synthase
MSTISQMRQICQPPRVKPNGKKAFTGAWYNVIFGRYLSIYITWLFLRLGVSANGATFIMILCGLAGPALLVPRSAALNLAGLVLMQLWIFMDCVDGEIARYTKTSSRRGVYLDHVSHALAGPMFIAGPCLHLLLWYAAAWPYFWLALIGPFAWMIRHVAAIEQKQFMTADQKAARPKSGATTPPRRLPPGLIRKAVFIFRLGFEGLNIMLLASAAMLLSYAAGSIVLKAFAWFYGAAGAVDTVLVVATIFRKGIPEEKPAEAATEAEAPADQAKPASPSSD